MAETKDFSYEGEAHFTCKGGLIDPQQPIWGRKGEWTFIKDSEITNVQFLTPAKVTFTSEDGEKQVRLAYVDVINKQAFDEEGNTFFSDEIFDHLQKKNSLTEEFYMADDEISQKAVDAKESAIKSE